jgi:surface protein
MFYNASSFNQPLSGWDVSSATTMNSMFYKATSFNQDLSLWDVSSVTDMSRMMFEGAAAFNHERYKISGKWVDVPNEIA